MKPLRSKYKITIFAALFALLLNCTVYSQSNTIDTTKTTIGGLIDFYYSNNLGNPANRTNKFRNFDVSENQFNVSLAKLTIQKPASPIGFKLDFAYGPTADIVQSSDPNKSINFLQQAMLTVVIPIGKGLTVNAGKMATHMGGEVIESVSNPNYSRSFLFVYAIPYYHVGLCATYPVSDNLSFTGYIYNGWNIMQDNNKEKTLGVEIIWTPSSNLTVIENWIGGAEQPDSVSTNKRHVFDTIVNYTASDNFSLSLNADYGFEKQANGDLAIWKGVALIGKYTIDAASALALRCEVYSDPYGFTTGTVQDLKELTLTYEYKFRSNLLCRLEYRRDWSNILIFDSKEGVNTKTDQNTLLVSTVISF